MIAMASTMGCVGTPEEALDGLAGDAGFGADETVVEEPGQDQGATGAIPKAAAPPVGTLVGEPGVSDSGSATYRIPLPVPPGTNGHQPQLALAYDSERGDGLMGPGWSIAGLSQVTRCPRTEALDGQHGGINLDGNDRYCLDGERLIAQNGGIDGAAGTEYLVVSDARIKARSVSVFGTHGPHHFEVFYPDGSSAQFGLTWTSHIFATRPGAGSTAARTGGRVWALEQLTDPAGNTIYFSWNHDYRSGQYVDQGGDYRPDTITYGGDVSITFGYEDRSERDVALEPRYPAGVSVENTKRLVSITTRVGSTEVHTFKLAYQSSLSAIGHSRLASVQQCTGSACLPATTFTWNESAIDMDHNLGAVTALPVLHGVIGLGYAAFAGDYNADALADLLLVNNVSGGDNQLCNGPSLTCAMSTTTDLGYGVLTDEDYPTTPVEWGHCGQWYGQTVCLPQAGDNVDRVTGDFDGDGATDLFRSASTVFLNDVATGFPPRGTDYSVCSGSVLSAPQRTACYPDWTYSGVWTYQGEPESYKHWGATKNIVVGDYDGDGRSDFYLLRAPSRNGDNFNSPFGGSQYFCPQGATVSCALNDDVPCCVQNNTGYWEHFEVGTGDFGADGRTDLLLLGDAGYGSHVCSGSGLATAGWANSTCKEITNPSARGDWRGVFDPVVGDFNGDGASDVFLMRTPGDNSSFCPGPGIADGGNCQSIANTSGWATSFRWYAGDFNGDGISDLIRQSASQVELCPGPWVANAANWAQVGTCETILTGAAVIKSITPADFDGNGSTDLLIAYDVDSNPNYGMTTLVKGRSSVQDRLASVTDGMNGSTTWTYRPLSDATVYTKGTGAVYPQHDEISGQHVVYRMFRRDGRVATDGSLPNATFTYHYAQLRSDLRYRESLGFGEVTVLDGRSGITTTRTLLQEPPFVGRVASEIQTRASGITLSEVTSSWETTDADCTACVVYADEVIVARFEPTGALAVTTSTARSQVDLYGNVGTELVNWIDGTPADRDSSRTTVTQWSPDTEVHWRLHRPTHIEVSATGTAEDPGTRTTDIWYDNPLGTNPDLLARARVEQNNDASTRLALSLEFDASGRVLKETVSGAGIATSRVTTRTYSGRFLRTVTNALNQTTTLTYGHPMGLKTVETDPNNITSTWSYDGFGRLTSEQLGSGASRTLSYEPATASWTASRYPAAWMQVRETPGGAAARLRYLDRLGREVATETPGMGASQLIATWTEYDALGRVARRSVPHDDAARPGASTTFGYDLLDRVTSEARPDGTWTNVYGPLVVRSTTPAPRVGEAPQTTETQFDAAGNIKRVIDAANGSVHHLYDGFGQKVRTTDERSLAVWTWTYDLRGRVKTESDPDRGLRTYTYDATGALTKTRFPSGREINQTYDVLARISSRSETGSTPASPTWTYTYGTSPGAYNVGKLVQIDGTDAAIGTRETFAYRPTGLLATHATRPAGGSVSEGFVYSYDAQGRTRSVSYPQGQLILWNTYNTRSGYLDRIERIAAVPVTGLPTSPTLLWRADARDAFGNVTQETLGNGLTSSHTYNATTGRLEGISTANSAVQNLSYTWDTVGNLRNRVDTRANRREELRYDALNHLIQATTYNAAVGGTVSADLRNGYTLGTLSCKEATAAPTATTCPGGLRIAHAAAPTVPVTVIGPHQIGEVFSTAGVSSGAWTYNVDGLPTLTRTPSRVQALGEWSYQRPRAINTTPTGAAATYERRSYGHDGRLLHVSTSGATTTDITYVDGFYERRTVSGLVTHRHTINAGGRTVAVYNPGQSEAWNPAKVSYLHHDALGSIHTITSSAGVVVETNSYSAWGQHRNAISWTGTAAANTTRTDEAFTGQRELPGHGLLDYGARLYDPTVGHFLEPDPVTQDPNTSEGLNPYAYCGNNPTSRIDPTGMSFWGTVGRVFRTVFKVVGAIASVLSGGELSASWGNRSGWSYGYSSGGFGVSFSTGASLATPQSGGSDSSSQLPRTSGSESFDGRLASTPGGSADADTAYAGWGALWSCDALCSEVGRRASFGLELNVNAGPGGGSYRKQIEYGEFGGEWSFRQVDAFGRSLAFLFPVSPLFNVLSERISGGARIFVGYDWGASDYSVRVGFGRGAVTLNGTVEGDWTGIRVGYGPSSPGVGFGQTSLEIVTPLGSNRYHPLGTGYQWGWMNTLQDRYDEAQARDKLYLQDLFSH